MNPARRPPRLISLIGLLAVLLVIVLSLGWWLARRDAADAATPTTDTAVSTTSAKNTAIASDCPLPIRVADGAPPLQSAVPDGMAPFQHPAARLQPLAGFSVDARVLARADYHDDREALLAPTDLALGWGRMREDAVLSRLDIRQAERWYHYGWSDPEPPLHPREMMISSANMHIIPANADIARLLQDVRRDQRVQIHGWLVQADAEDGWRWRSSTRRDDTGRGACEVVYVCALSVRPAAP